MTKKCWECNGTGLQKYQVSTNIEDLEPCPICNGTGKINEDKLEERSRNASDD